MTGQIYRALKWLWATLNDIDWQVYELILVAIVLIVLFSIPQIVINSTL
jgi:hypothetical protein